MTNCRGRSTANASHHVDVNVLLWMCTLRCVVVVVVVVQKNRDIVGGPC